MSDLKAQLKEILLQHRGRKKAIKRPLIIDEILRFDGYRNIKRETLDRAVREAKEELIAEDFPILSCSTNPSGYYLPEDVKELEEGIETSRAYLIQEAKNIYNLTHGGKLWLDQEEAKRKRELVPVQGVLI